MLHTMSYVRHVRHRNIRCHTCIRYRRSEVRHRMFSSYTTSYVLTCISYLHAYNIAYNIAYDIAYDIVCDVHSIGFGAGFRGFKLHARSRRHRSLHGNVLIQASTAPPAAAGTRNAIAAALGSGGRGSIRSGFGTSGRFLLLLSAAAARFRRERTRLDRRNT